MTVRYNMMSDTQVHWSSTSHIINFHRWHIGRTRPLTSQPRDACTTSQSQLVYNLLPGNHSEPPFRDPGGQPLGLRVALAHVCSVHADAFLEPVLDEFLDAKDCGWLQTADLGQDVSANGGVKGFGRLLWKYFAKIRR